MFHKELTRQITALDKRIDNTNETIRDRYYSLRGDLDRLIEALGLVKDERHINRYIKKGGPEEPI